MRDTEEIRWDERASPSWRWSLRSSRAGWFTDITLGSSLLYTACITCCLAALRSSYCLLSIAVCFSNTRSFLRDLCFRLMKELRARWFQHYLEHPYTRWHVFCFKLGLGFKVLVHDDSLSLLDDEWQHCEISNL